MRFFGLSQGDLPAVVVHDTSKSLFYIKRKTSKTKSMQTFIEDALAGRRQPSSPRQNKDEL